MHIVHYTSAHPWTSTRIFSKMCVHLAALGHRVSLVAVDPQAQTLQTFTDRGVEVHLLPGATIRGRLRRALISGARVTAYAHDLKGDVLHFHDPELIAHALYRRFGTSKLVFDAHEDFVTQTDGKDWAAGPRRFAVKTAARLLRKAIARRADGIVVATDGVGRDYPAETRTVVRNLPILAEFPAERARRPLVERSRDICYVGSLSKIRGVVEMIEAAHRSQTIETLHLAGKFEPPHLDQELSALPGWEKVRYHGYINRDQITQLLDQVRVGLVLLHPLRNYVDSLPIKLLEYRAAGVPILASDFEYWYEFVQAGETGEFVDPLDVESIAAALDRLASDDGAEAFEQLFSADTSSVPAWEEEVAVLDRFYRKVAA